MERYGPLTRQFSHPAEVVRQARREAPAGTELKRRPDAMQISISAQPVVALIAGILILLVPRLLSYIVAIYLIIFSILGLVR